MAEAAAIECVGCGARFAPYEGATHPYMKSSPACWHAFGNLLAAEYADDVLLLTHRLSVDTYAVQHPGDASRQAIQSVGLHLARLHVQLEHELHPKETNDVMLGFSKRKSSLSFLEPPNAFSMTIADLVPVVGTDAHIQTVRDWSNSAWDDWKQHHEYIRRWIDET